jgi:hypothetical protein
MSFDPVGDKSLDIKYLFQPNDPPQGEDVMKDVRDRLEGLFDCTTDEAHSSFSFPNEPIEFPVEPIRVTDLRIKHIFYKSNESEKEKVPFHGVYLPTAANFELLEALDGSSSDGKNQDAEMKDKSH